MNMKYLIDIGDSVSEFLKYNINSRLWHLFFLSYEDNKHISLSQVLGPSPSAWAWTAVPSIISF